jgi:putative endonuclease
VKYYTYILKCADGALYAGITTDLKRKVAEHNGDGNLGARYTRARRPVKLVYSAELLYSSSASKEEYRIK